VPTKVYFVRHGASENFDALENDEDRDVIRQDQFSHLGLRGRTQAKKLGPKIANIMPDVALCSHYMRAKETLDLIIKDNSYLFPNIDTNLGEIRRIVDGKSIYDDLVKKYKIWRGRVFEACDMTSKFDPNDESHGEFRQRVVGFKRRLPVEFDGQTILVVGHSQFFAMFLTTLVHGDKLTPPNFFNRYFMDHCAITTVEYTHDHGWKIIDFNDTKHLK